MKEEKLVPELRFPEFEGEWEKNKLGDLVSFKKGRGIPKRELSDTGNKCILYGELYTKYNEIIKEVYSCTELDIDKLILSKSGDVLIPSSGETALDMSLASSLLLEGIALGGDINILSPKKEKLDSNFLSYQINSVRKIDLARKAEGASVVHLYNSNLKNLYINNPEIEEQEKIGSFFYKIDKKSNIQERKIEELKSYKKAMMQKIFDQEVRFKDKDGKEYPKWEKKKVEDIISSVPVKQHQILSREIKKEGLYPVITQSKEYVDGFFDDSDKTCYENPVILFGDHTTVLKYIDFDFIVGGDGVKILKSNSNKYNLKFIYYILKYKNITIQGYRRHFSLLRELLVNISSLKEQNKIVEILSLVDKKIELEKEKLEKYKSFKKGLMQRMFI